MAGTQSRKALNMYCQEIKTPEFRKQQNSKQHLKANYKQRQKL